MAQVTDEDVQIQKDAEAFSKQLDDYAAGKLRKDIPLTVGKTPYVLERLGAKQLPVVIDQGTIQKCTKDKHGLSLDDLKKITAQINDPIMVFDSASALERKGIQSQTTKNNDSFVVMTSITHKNKTVVVAIHLEKSAGRHIVNDVASVHPRSSDYHFVNWIEQGLLRYYHKGKARNWFMTRGLQLPKVRRTNPSSGNKILINADLVKSVSDTLYSAEETASQPKRLDADGLKQLVADLVAKFKGISVIERGGVVYIKVASGEARAPRGLKNAIYSR